MTNFLPQNYKAPDNSNYLKLKDGQNKFRILSSAIIGWEYWTEENKPMRSKAYPKETPNIRMEKDGSYSRIKHFWAFIVYNYESKKIQIMEVTQSTIQSGIKSLVDNESWGDPKTFDLVITRKGEGFDTEYTVMPNPKSPVPEEATEEYENKTINIEALYDGKDPFERE